MEFSIGEAVFVDGLEGIYLIDGDVPERGCYRVKLSGLPVPSIEVPKSKVHKISTKAVEQIRAASDVGVENAEPDNEVRPVSPYTPEQILVGTAREAVIKPLYLGQITKEQAEQKLSIGRTVLNDLLRRYREWQSWEALVPGVSGRRKGDTRLEDEVEEILAKAIDEDYKGPGASVVAVLNRVRWECNAISKSPPSASTVERRCAQSSMRKAVANNQGPVAARDKFDSFPFGTVTQRALELGQADNSPLDCQAVDPDTGKVLGRPNLTIISDDHTESYLGFWLSYAAPSRNTLANAFFMALQPKDELLAEFALSARFKWIQYGKLSRLRTDGGGDLNAKTVLATLAKNDIRHERRMRPQSGGKVERKIGVVNRYFIQTLNGAIASSRKIARGENPEKLAEYSIKDLFILIITQICILHERAGDDGLTPNQRWMRDFGEKDGVIRTPPVVKDATQFKIDMLHQRNIHVRREGLLTLGLLYEPGPYWNRVGEPVTLKLDYGNLHRAWVMDEGLWVPVKLINADIYPKTMMEWNIQRKSGLPVGQHTAEGLQAMQEQHHLKQSLLTQQQERRLQESRDLEDKMCKINQPASSSLLEPKAPAKPHQGPIPVMMGYDL